MPEHKLLNAEREHRILELLRHSTVMTVGGLSNELSVSEATIRRDLQSMHERKLLQRVRGGATLHPVARVEPVFHDKATQHQGIKRRIAAKAIDLIEDHDVIYLDGGSTVLMLAERLDEREGLTVVTNSLMAASRLMGSDHRLILVGGEFRPLSRTLVGPLTAAVAGNLHVDKAFMGTIGFTIEDGMTTTDTNEAFTKEQIMKRSNQVILLADSSKLGIPSFARSGDIRAIDILITDRVDPLFRADLEANGIEVLAAGE
ncbi:MAG: DeoR/GlpR transcriptional regulator [Lentisphaerae bacterium]|jgi:DeoR/GlpR family transcriptional regulator of sugar metabolism|nr:DeoR/GlpR transcriptional regulator [Lentisphaerota bacterium]MBT4816182.1 DeoR/GlpR transcriptional regulator [Lentisphaerota bacterium]MBT5606627.1 DeoR/GlpR transcriptional regulator [Lentisphaerota bacterium]MBT7059530.1 DeoR/GlpR transcriptional regulator [Lentisphaerota bacterium]MBT7843033.1 DeoR/GlpR transcriptional regulator [Lentisphaerota bacterium]